MVAEREDEHKSPSSAMRTTTKLKLLLTCVALSAVFTLFFGAYPLNPTICNCNNNCDLQFKDYHQDIFGVQDWDRRHKLCILVPFRDRLEELLEFAPHIHSFLNRQLVRHAIVVINQVDDHRFNRASLINVGFLESDVECDYIAMHDVDLLPLNDELSYRYPGAGPFHLSSPQLHPRYHYEKFVGGILLMTREHFKKVNGLSNKYWGWGLEDDEFYLRLMEAKLNVTRPSNISTGTKDTFRHAHDQNKRRRDMARLDNQKKISRQRDRLTGLNNVNYRSVKSYAMTIDNAVVTMINVELVCDRSLTPFCDNKPTATTKTSVVVKRKDSKTKPK